MSNQLTITQEVSKVTVLGRREAPLFGDYAALQSSPKLVHRVVGAFEAAIFKTMHNMSPFKYETPFAQTSRRCRRTHSLTTTSPLTRSAAPVSRRARRCDACMRKHHNSSLQAAFRHIDLDYTASVAALAHQAGIQARRPSPPHTAHRPQQFHLVSSRGADPDSMFLYMEVKGKVGWVMGCGACELCRRRRWSRRSDSSM